MDNNILKILNEELLESKRRTKLAEQRLDLHSKEFHKRSKLYEQQQKALEEIQRTQKALQLTSGKHQDLLNQHKAGFEIMFRNMEKMEQRMDIELNRLRKKN